MKWINIGDGLPPYAQIVFAYAKKTNKTTIAACYTEKNGDHGLWYDYNAEKHIYEITHWHPIKYPEKPKINEEIKENTK